MLYVHVFVCECMCEYMCVCMCVCCVCVVFKQNEARKVKRKLQGRKIVNVFIAN